MARAEQVRRGRASARRHAQILGTAQERRRSTVLATKMRRRSPREVWGANAWIEDNGDGNAVRTKPLPSR